MNDQEQNTQDWQSEQNSQAPTLGKRSLILSLAFFAWWFLWAVLGTHSGLAARLNLIFLGLPLWFWLSSIVSLPLLFSLSIWLLPDNPRPAPDSGRQQAGGRL